MGLVTGSRIARILGISPFGGPMSVYAELVDGAEIEESKPMKRGRLFEPAVLAWHAEDAGCTLEPSRTLVHPKHPRIGATPDAIAIYQDGERRVVEAKIVGWQFASQWGPAGTDQIPDYYVAQCQFEMGCAGLTKCDVCALIGADDFRQYVVEFDELVFARLVREGERFLLEHVDPRIPPPPDGTVAWDEWIKIHLPLNERSVVVPADDAAEIRLRELERAEKAFKEAEREYKRTRQEVELLIADADAIAGQCGRVSWKKTKGRATTDWEGLAKFLGASDETVKRFTSAGEGHRRFLTTWAKK